MKLLSKIRKSLLYKSKFSEYMLYAIGEIILVVVGILIALQIDNANTYQEKRVAEQQYLIALQTEFKTNHSRIKETIVKNDSIIRAVNDILSLFNHKTLKETDDNSIAKKIFSIFENRSRYIATNGVLRDLIGSGNLNLIENKKLREQLSSFESSLLNIKELEDESHDILIKLKNIYLKKGSLQNLLILVGAGSEQSLPLHDVSNRSIFYSLEFKNRSLDYLLTLASLNEKEHYVGLQEQIELILEQIRLEINNND